MDKKGILDIWKRRREKEKEEKRKAELDAVGKEIMELFVERKTLTMFDILKEMRKRSDLIDDSSSDYYSPKINRAVNYLNWEKRYLDKEGPVYRLTEEGRMYLGIEGDEETPVLHLKNPGEIEVES